MFKTVVTPRFYETDAFGHINNTVVNGWFETARRPIFGLFGKGPNIGDMCLILARTEVDFIAQIFYGEDVDLYAFIESIGNKSFVVGHEAYQSGRLVARGKAVQVHYDPKTRKGMSLTPQQIDQLNAWKKPT
jgi:acyl-CoA thioester hydrolase